MTPKIPRADGPWRLQLGRELAHVDLSPSAAMLLLRISWRARWSPDGSCSPEGCYVSDTTLGGHGDLPPGSKGLLSRSQVQRLLASELRPGLWVDTTGRGKGRRVLPSFRIKPGGGVECFGEPPEDKPRKGKKGSSNTRADATASPSQLSRPCVKNCRADATETKTIERRLSGKDERRAGLEWEPGCDPPDPEYEQEERLLAYRQGLTLPELRRRQSEDT